MSKCEIQATTDKVGTFIPALRLRVGDIIRPEWADGSEMLVKIAKIEYCGEGPDNNLRLAMLGIYSPLGADWNEATCFIEPTARVEVIEFGEDLAIEEGKLDAYFRRQKL